MHFVYDDCGDHGLLKMHTPPWEFGCNCKLEQITAKRAGKTSIMIRPPTPPEKVHVESKSGYTFDPETVFKEFDFELIKNDVLRKEAKDGVEKLIGTVNTISKSDIDK